MKTRIGWCALLLLCANATWSAPTFPRAIDARSELELREREVIVHIAFQNQGTPWRGEVDAEWLDPQDAVLSRGSAHAELKAGESVVAVSMPSPFSMFPSDKQQEAVWHRIRYTLRAADGAASGPGILSLCSMQSKLFVLQVLAPTVARGGDRIHAIVRAVNPATEAPVQGVALSVQYAEQGSIAITATTDSAGQAQFQLPAPANGAGDEENISIHAHVAGYSQKATHRLEIDRECRQEIRTDKNLYQPGQTVHTRTVAFGPDGKALANTQVQISLHDTRGAKVMASEATSNKFGVAAADLALPDRAEPGAYFIQSEIVGGEFDGSSAEEAITVAKYDVPTFAVRAKPVRPWYLAGQEIRIAVNAQYVFGKPLQGGHVSVTEGGISVAEGELENGASEIAVSNPATKRTFQRAFSVSVKEPGGRTEKQDLTVPVADQAIDVTFSGETRLSSRFPAPLYVTARYPDGTPAQCSGAIDVTAAAAVRRALPIRTNRLGVAAIDGFVLPGAADSYKLEARVSDAKGDTGATKLDLQPQNTGIRIETDRLIYRKGQAIDVRVHSAKEADQFYIAIVSDDQVFDFKLIGTQNHSGSVAFPYREGFSHLLRVQAQRVQFGLDAEAADAVAVYYDTREELNLQIQPARSEYAPGERASLRMRLTDAHGDPVQGAIGLSVIDKAVEGLGGSRGEFFAWWNRGDLQLNAADTDPESLVAARAELAGQESYPIWFPSLFVPKAPELYYLHVEKDTLAVRAALKRWHDAGNPYPTDSAALSQALASEGVNLNAMLDPWETPYRAEIGREKEYTQLVIRSAGPDRRFGDADDLRDIQLSWRWFDDYVVPIQKALMKAATFPSSAVEFRRLMAKAGLGRALTAPDGRPLIVQVGRKTVNFRDTNFFDYPDYAAHGQSRMSATDTTAKAGLITVFELLGKPGEYNSRLQLGSFTGPPDPDLSKLFGKPLADSQTSLRGGVRGEVRDPIDGCIANATIEASSQTGEQVYRAKSGEDGRFVLFLPEGTWTIRASSPGFNAFVVAGVPIASGLLTEVNPRLQIGSVSEVVEVIAEPQTVNTSSANVIAPMRKPAMAPSAPPLARKYFPETLFWAPLLETDSDGWVSASFDLADSITTWKLNAIGSSADGGVVDEAAEIRAFRPFFLDFTPPRYLTQGDEIELPATLRNYGSEAEPAKLRASLTGGLEPAGSMEAAVSAAAGEGAGASFRMRAASRGKATVRIDALGNQSRDAIEKTIEVRPDGRRVAATVSEGIRDTSELKFSIPPDALAGTARGRLLIYPSMAAQIFDARRAILERPWGCGEQTISSTFPDLLVLDYLRRTKIADTETEAKALVYLKAGYGRLLGFQSAGGGFSYFGAESDAALTAYAIEFLDAASAFITTDRTVVERAANWLWTAKADLKTGSAAAYAVAMLANHSQGRQGQLSQAIEQIEKSGALNDPHSAASLIRIYSAQGNSAALRTALDRLLNREQQSEAGDRYWSSGPTPFWETGRPGDIETTSMALRALEIAKQAGAGGLDPDIQGAARWLVRNKDEFGGWWVGHASVRALQALAPLAQGADAVNGAHSLVVNERAIPLKFGSAEAPADIDLSPWVRPGENRVRFSGAFAESTVAVLTGEYYAPWTSAAAPANASARLSVSFDRNQARVGEAVECTAEITSTGNSAFGMSVAEIGLPPGAEVDRASLDRANWKNGLWRYEIEPDRVILYFWSRGVRESVRFTFRPRFAMRAKSAPSELWQYYNPDERVSVAPVGFVIRP